MELALILLAVMVLREFSFNRERTQAANERQELLQRIQAPAAAVASFATGEEHVPGNPVPALSDDELWDVINGD